MRRLIFNIHLYAGLAVGLLLTSAGLTGSVLVWHAELDALLAPELVRVEPAAERISIERVLAAARAAHPEQPASRVQMPRDPTQTFEITTAGEVPVQVYVDPYRGTVLGSRGQTDSFVGWLYYWHTSLLAGEAGERVMGVSALLLLVLVGTGVVVWWPGVRRLKDALRVKWGANWKRVNFDLHRAGGIWSSLLLCVLAVTGASLVFHDAFMAGLNRITASPPPPAAPPAPTLAGAPRLPVDSLVRVAQRVIPGAEVTYVILPAGPESPLTVRMKQAPELHPNGRNFVHLHPQTGEVLAVQNALTAPIGTRAYNVLYPLHIGRWGGVPSRILYSLLGLVPLLLSVSGFLMWRNRVGGKRRKAPRPPARRPAAGPSPGSPGLAPSRRRGAGAAGSHERL